MPRRDRGRSHRARRAESSSGEEQLNTDPFGGMPALVGGGGDMTGLSQAMQAWANVEQYPPLKFGLASDQTHPLHGAVVEIVKPLPALSSHLAFAVQFAALRAIGHGGSETQHELLPVHDSDLLDYVWPNLVAAGGFDDMPQISFFNGGSKDGQAPPRVMFTALKHLADAVPQIQNYLAENPQVAGHALHVILFSENGSNGVAMKDAEVPYLTELASEVRSKCEVPGGATGLHLTCDMLTGAAYFGSTAQHIAQQIAANRWLALRTLITRLEGHDTASLIGEGGGRAPELPRTAAGKAGAFIFVEHSTSTLEHCYMGGISRANERFGGQINTGAALVQGAAFVVPLQREPGARIGGKATLTGLVGRADLNGKQCEVLRASGLRGSHDGWRNVAEDEALQVDRFAARVAPEGELVRLRPANMVEVRP